MISSLNFPLFLTLLRFVGAPCILAPLLVRYLPRKTVYTALWLAVLFVAFGLTDFFDGYYARAWGQTSLLGSLLDPVADKMLVVSVCFALVACGRLWYGWALLFTGREFLVMSLREIALAHGFLLPVAIWGKWKTFFQFAYLGVLIINVHRGRTPWLYALECTMLCAAVICTLASGWYYWTSCAKFLPGL